MNQTDLLLDILEDLNKRREEVDSIIGILSLEGKQNNFLFSAITKVEIALVQSLGGNKEHKAYLYTDRLYPFDNFEEGNIDREQLVKYIRLAIKYDLVGDQDINGKKSLEETIRDHEMK
ncbi:hypothetical protein LGQ02_11290 [Bacillus shivajii]|uniref:hypothetical protein n=1 Tax=Bacillus shivajii TaxID=1983719 RepID=UPI001CFAFECB|nr:hypothetical protein [Bacillus shivajii]UCZ51461.1 hypothetical protein LGQ02_11290 [Bacillus shivajii]